MDTKSALQKEYVDNKSFDIEEIGNKLFGKVQKKNQNLMKKWNSTTYNMITLLSPMKVL